MTTIGKVRLAKSRSVRVVLDLDATSANVLAVLVKQSGRTEAEIVGDALMLLFVALPGDGETDSAAPPSARTRP